MNYELTRHARDVLAERNIPLPSITMPPACTSDARDVLAERCIPLEWLEQTLREPELKVADPTDATLERRYRKIPEHGNRVLRVVVSTAVAPERLVSVYFDRTMKGKL
jgi:hypothetical protein